MNSQVTVSPAWFETWFDTPHYHRLYAAHDGCEATAFVDRLVDWFCPGPAARMLDLGCGSGRHSRALAVRGFDVTGLDLAENTIRRARRHETRRLRFVHQDMREPFGDERYDYVFSFFTSFGYFADGGEDDRIVRNIAGALKAEGALVLDYLNVRWSERRLVSREEREIDGHRYHITRWSDDAHFFKRIEVEEPDSAIRQLHMERVAKFRLADFEILLGRRGLEIEAVFGDYDLGPYDAETSPRLIVVARKRAAEARRAA